MDPKNPWRHLYSDVALPLPGRSVTTETVTLHRIVLTLCDVALTNAQRELSMVTLSVADPRTIQEGPLPFWVLQPLRNVWIWEGLSPRLRNPGQMSPDVRNRGVSGTVKRNNVILMAYLYCRTRTRIPIDSDSKPNGHILLHRNCSNCTVSDWNWIPDSSFTHFWDPCPAMLIGHNKFWLGGC